MERQRRKATWFATLRRDGRLFALLALALVAIQALQPLAAARASEANGHLVICTALGNEPQSDGAPVRHEGCAECVAGACGLSTQAQSGAAWTAAFEPIATRLAPHLLGSEPRPLASSYAERPPAIRAPPSAV